MGPAAFEAIIAQLLARDETSPGTTSPGPTLGDSQAHGPAESSLPPRPVEALVAGSPRPDTDRLKSAAQFSREVRHVAIVTLKLHGFSTLERWVGAAGVSRAADKIKATLDDIAYKRGARFVWEPDETARPLVRPLANLGHGWSLAPLPSAPGQGLGADTLFEDLTIHHPAIKANPIRARVAWAMGSKDDTSALGIQFLDMDSETRISLVAAVDAVILDRKET